METKIAVLTSKITEFYNYKTHKIDEFISCYAKPISIVIATRDDVGYMLFVHVKFDDLPMLCSDIQIDIFTKLKTLISEKHSAVVGLSNSFDKNSTLIVSTIVPEKLSEIDKNKLISSIEEDFYYYKKQVLTFKESDQKIVKDLTNYKDGPVIACGLIVSSISNYETFTTSGSDKYRIAAMLYEKLPFLTLDIDRVEPLILQDMINAELSDEQLDELAKYQELTTQESIVQWVNTIGVKDDKAG